VRWDKSWAGRFSIYLVSITPARWRDADKNVLDLLIKPNDHYPVNGSKNGVVKLSLPHNERVISGRDSSPYNVLILLKIPSPKSSSLFLEPPPRASGQVRAKAVETFLVESLTKADPDRNLSSLELSDTQSLLALNTSPPRNRFTFLRSSFS